MAGLRCLRRCCRRMIRLRVSRSCWLLVVVRRVVLEELLKLIHDNCNDFLPERVVAFAVFGRRNTGLPAV